MDRRKFIKNSCLTCLGSMGIMTLLDSCSGPKYISQFEKKENHFVVKKTEFIQVKNGISTQLPFVLIKTDSFPFPIALYKMNKEDYKALFLQCTHQGCELTPFEHMIVCPCHGAEFTIEGDVSQGPAETQLTSFKTTNDHENIYIYFA